MRRRAVGRVAMRAQMVLLSARGYTVPQIAEIFELGEEVVRDWLHRFQERGPDGLEDHPRPGRPPQDRLARHIVDAQMRAGWWGSGKHSKEVFGLPAYPRSKDQRDKSMLGERAQLLQDAVGQVAFDPADMVKALRHVQPKSRTTVSVL
ncbi:MAG TPA: helix-turn-helix domain-containing protein [Gemmataceae bacterium]|nr:helix-turn-helix domain-containing protein [Gemmataceae bacterium]